jgi:hypothetical protein
LFDLKGRLKDKRWHTNSALMLSQMRNGLRSAQGFTQALGGYATTTLSFTDVTS